MVRSNHRPRRGEPDGEVVILPTTGGVLPTTGTLPTTWGPTHDVGLDRDGSNATEAAANW